MMMEYQPNVWQEHTTTYQEVAPDVRLRSHIQSYWVSYTTPDTSPSRIIPDLCSDLIVRLTPELEVLQLDICGPSTQFFYSNSNQSMVYFGIRYYLGGMYPFLEQSFKEVKNQLLDLALFEKRIAAELVERLSGSDSLAELINRADLYFLERLTRSNIKRISTPIQVLFKEHYRGCGFAESIKNSALSERSLQRLFREETGLSPYEVFDVLRFQKVYQELISAPVLNHLDLVEKYGFFDQAHYSRKLKKMTGLSPQAIRQYVGILQDKY